MLHLYSVIFAGFSAESLRGRITDSECVHVEEERGRERGRRDVSIDLCGT